MLDTIISVEDVKIFKVSPRVYNLGPERLGVGRSALGFVSSNAWDIAGAASAGLTTFWIQRSAAEPPEELGFAADRVVAAITDSARPAGACPLSHADRQRRPWVPRVTPRRASSVDSVKRTVHGCVHTALSGARAGLC